MTAAWTGMKIKNKKREATHHEQPPEKSAQIH